MNTKKNVLGFTLIELLVVIAIIGILAVLIVVNLNGVRSRMRDTQRKSDFSQLKRALLMYKNDYKLYPASDSDNKILICTAGSLADWGMPFKCDTMTYMKLLPFDPSLDQSYKYVQMELGENYCLVATLENKSDSDITKSQQKCSECSSYFTVATDFVECAD